MRSRWKITFIICVVLIAAVLAGCGAAEQRPALEKMEYTNLNDSGSRELLQELLSDAGVSDGRIQGFFRRVDHFNDSVKQEWLTDGFEEAELLYTKYDPYTMQDEWTAKNGTLYFVEKVAFQEPYRLLRFANRRALSDYLMGKYDTSWGQDTATPFIMENDKLMDGWRPNPDSGSSALG